MVFESKYYADFKKTLEYYNKAALPYYQQALAKSKELMEMWPICKAVEYAALAKAYVAKNMPVYGSGAVGGAA